MLYYPFVPAAEHERAINEHKSLKSQLERMQSARESERRVSEDTVKETEERLNSAVRAQIQEEARCREALSSNIQYRVTIDNLRSQVRLSRLLRTNASSLFVKCLHSHFLSWKLFDYNSAKRNE